jgi:hypothetical protein
MPFDSKAVQSNQSSLKHKSPKKNMPEGKYAINNEDDSDSDEDDLNYRTSNAKMLKKSEEVKSSPVQGEMMSSSEEEDDS